MLPRCVTAQMLPSFESTIAAQRPLTATVVMKPLSCWLVPSIKTGEICEPLYCQTPFPPADQIL